MQWKRRWKRFPIVTAYLFLAVMVAEFLVMVNQSGRVLSGDRAADERSFSFLNTGIIVFRDDYQYLIFALCLMGLFTMMGVIEIWLVRRWHRRHQANVG